MTQIEKVKFLLNSGFWICGTEFQQEFIPEYRTRIGELRRRGMKIEARPCTQHNHKSRTLQEWRIERNSAPVAPLLVRNDKRAVQPLFTHYSTVDL